MLVYLLFLLSKRNDLEKPKELSTLNMQRRRRRVLLYVCVLTSTVTTSSFDKLVDTTSLTFDLYHAICVHAISLSLSLSLSLFLLLFFLVLSLNLSCLHPFYI